MSESPTLRCDTEAQTMPPPESTTDVRIPRDCDWTGFVDEMRGILAEMGETL